MTEEKKRRGAKIISAVELLNREPHRTIIEIIYLLEGTMGEAEPKQILNVFNAKEDPLYTKHVREHHAKIIRNRVYNIDLYESNTHKIKRIIQSRPDKPKYNITRFNLRDYLNILLKWQIVEKIERGSYKIADPFKKEFVRKSNKEIINGYIADEITPDKYGITLYGVELLAEQLEENPEGQKHLNNIKNTILNIKAELWQVSRDIQKAKYHLAISLLSKELKNQSPAIKEFFSQHDLVSLLDFQHMFKVLDAMNGFDNIEVDFHVKEIEIVKDYLHLHQKEQNTIKELLTKCKKERSKHAYPFTLFYSDATFSPTPRNLDATLKESRYKAIWEDDKLSYEEKAQRAGELYLTSKDFAMLEARNEEWKEIQEKLKELGNKYDDHTPVGDIPEIRELIEKQLEKALIERKKIEEES